MNKPAKKTLVKMKNGRHRVASPSECKAIAEARTLAIESSQKQRNINSLYREVEVLQREFDINTMLAERMIEEYGQKAKPHVLAFIKAAEQRHRPKRLVELYSREITWNSRVRRHTVHIPEVFFEFEAEIHG